MLGAFAALNHEGGGQLRALTLFKLNGRTLAIPHDGETLALFERLRRGGTQRVVFSMKVQAPPALLQLFPQQQQRREESKGSSATESKRSSAGTAARAPYPAPRHGRSCSPLPAFRGLFAIVLVAALAWLLARPR